MIKEKLFNLLKIPHKNQDEQGDTAQFRQNLFGLSNINNFNNPFASFFNRLPNNIIRNPDTAPPLTKNYESCVDASGLSGICIRPLLCNTFGGRLSGSCGLGTVCCISTSPPWQCTVTLLIWSIQLEDTLAKCGGQMTVNNTYWQSPVALSSGSTCGVTITLDKNLLEQQKKACQVR